MILSTGLSLYDRILGLPFVYTRIRPLVVGGVDMTPSYENLAVGPDDVVVDVGCGPGEALKYLRAFKSLHGFDTDPIAISFARKLAAGRSNVSFEARPVTAGDLASIAPPRVMMNGLQIPRPSTSTRMRSRLATAASTCRSA